MTNHEFIKNMEIDEPAEFLEKFIPCLCCVKDKDFCYRDCCSGIWEWLEQEHEE